MKKIIASAGTTHSGYKSDSLRSVLRLIMISAISSGTYAHSNTNRTRFQHNSAIVDLVWPGAAKCTAFKINPNVRDFELASDYDHFVTAGHCCKGNPGKIGGQIDSEIVACDAFVDWCVLRSEPTQGPGLVIAQLNEWVQFDTSGSLRVGVLRDNESQWNPIDSRLSFDFFRHELAYVEFSDSRILRPGDSGGPLVLNDEVVGIAVGATASGDYYTPIWAVQIRGVPENPSRRYYPSLTWKSDTGDQVTGLNLTARFLYGKEEVYAERWIEKRIDSKFPNYLKMTTFTEWESDFAGNERAEEKIVKHRDKDQVTYREWRRTRNTETARILRYDGLQGTQQIFINWYASESTEKASLRRVYKPDGSQISYINWQQRPNEMTAVRCVRTAFDTTQIIYDDWQTSNGIERAKTVSITDRFGRDEVFYGWELGLDQEKAERRVVVSRDGHTSTTFNWSRT